MPPVWTPVRWNEPGRNPWIVLKGTYVHGVGQWITAFETLAEAQAAANILNAPHLIGA
jgi:hypothetical protein